jgi:hypothetical protein
MVPVRSLTLKAPFDINFNYDGAFISLFQDIEGKYPEPGWNEQARAPAERPAVVDPRKKCLLGCRQVVSAFILKT